MRINLPGFSHANYIVFLIIQQEFPSPLAFNYTLTRYFSPASFWAATCGESPWCVIITEGRGQRCCRTVLQLGKAMATSGIYVTDLLISARETSLLKAHSCPHFWPILTLTFNLNSPLPFSPSGMLRKRWQRAHKGLQTLQKFHPNKTSHSLPFLLSWFLGSMVSILVYLMDNILKRQLGSCSSPVAVDDNSELIYSLATKAKSEFMDFFFFFY